MPGGFLASPFLMSIIVLDSSLAGKQDESSEDACSTLAPAKVLDQTQTKPIVGIFVGFSYCLERGFPELVGRIAKDKL